MTTPTTCIPSKATFFCVNVFPSVVIAAVVIKKSFCLSALIVFASTHETLSSKEPTGNVFKLFSGSFLELMLSLKFLAAFNKISFEWME
ncbi:hypothetical protein D3C80_1564420 [compost metagenome]